MDEDGADGAAEDGTAVDAAQHDQARGRIHAEGDGQQQGHAHGGGKAGQAADGDAHDGGRQHGQQIDGRDGMHEACSHESQSIRHDDPLT